MPDDHPLSVAAGRTFALGNADLVLLLGARLNWILHFGLPPRFREDLRLVQLDIAAEEIGTNVPAEVALVGDGRAVMGQLNAALDEDPWQYPEETTWRSGLQNAIDANVEITNQMIADDSSPLNYQHVLAAIRDSIPRGGIIVSEGANTMDIGRTILNNYDARERLDAGSYGTMGVGMGFAIAASVVNPGKRIVAVEGDAAFGFSGMELETMCRHNLPITTMVINNNGIGGGVSELPSDRPPPPSVLLPGARYEKMIDAFGGRGYYVSESSELEPALREANEGEGPAIVNRRDRSSCAAQAAAVRLASHGPYLAVRGQRSTRHGSRGVAMAIERDATSGLTVVGRQNLMRPTDTHDASLLAPACCRLADSASAAPASVPPESRATMIDADASRCSAGRTHQAPAGDVVR